MARADAAPTREPDAAATREPDAAAKREPDAALAPSIPDPFDDADALEELGDAIATLAAQIHAADQRLLTLIADFDRRRGWELGGHRSCAHWVAVRTGIDLGASRERVRAARALARLPETSAAMARGELSFSAVRALTRVATPGNESDLLELARGCTTSRLERVVRAWKRGSRTEEADRERDLHESRSFAVFPDDEGMYVVKGRLPAEVGAVLMRAIEAASDALYREEAAPGGAPNPDEGRRAAARRRADAVGLLAERGLAAGFGSGFGWGSGSADGAGREGAEGGGAVPLSGSRAGRYQVVLHVDEATLAADGGEPGRSEMDDGTRVSAETSRRIACDASVVRVAHERNAPGPPRRSILDVGRRTRTVSPALRRALDVRDRGCRFPGCGLRFCDAHHVRHWADGGETSLGNCLLLCRFHHRLVHEGGWSIVWWGDGRPAFFDPRGGVHFDGRWQAPVPLGTPAERLKGLAAVGRDRGGDLQDTSPHPWTAGARWMRASEIPDSVLFRALEAMDGHDEDALS